MASNCARACGDVCNGRVAAARAVALRQARLHAPPGLQQARLGRGRVQEVGALHELRAQRVPLGKRSSAGQAEQHEWRPTWYP